MYNLCQYAHTPEELDEWRERWKWRLLKRIVAKKEGAYSYMEDLLEAYEAADSGVNVVSSLGFKSVNWYYRNCFLLVLFVDGFTSWLPL